jgi:hypothetical protein
VVLGSKNYIRAYDSGLQVVANAVTALMDIHEAAQSQPPSRSSSPADEDSPPPSATRPSPTLFIIDPPTLSKLLLALNECSEWGRIALLNALARYKTHDEKESEHICERVMPQFQHANAAVVLGAVKVGSLGQRKQHYRANEISVFPLGYHDPYEARCPTRTDNAVGKEDGASTW